jgi:hypothetical protein
MIAGILGPIGLPELIILGAALLAVAVVLRLRKERGASQIAVGAVVGVLVLILGGVIVAQLDADKAARIAKVVIAPRPQEIAFVEDVAPNYLNRKLINLEYSPARLHGNWRSSRIEKQGGITDDLVSFEIHGPGDQILYRAQGQEIGQFDIAMPVTGQYTIHMNNAGLLRATPRRVTFSATLEPR